MPDCSTAPLNSAPYVGRFAPSPTGKLHLGSLFTAVASWLHAKSHQGSWLVRMEDLDPPREEPGAAEHILETLHNWGLESDGPVRFQSQRLAHYQALTQQLLDSGQAYRCYCSRKQIAAAGLSSPEGWRYNGHCKQHPQTRPAQQHSVRLNCQLDAKQAQIAFNDELQGYQANNPEALYGDFPIKRADGFFAYQLAVVADDFSQGVTHVVRGIDLMHSTTRQIRLQNALGYPTPQYCHLPVLIGADGQKLSKQNLAKPIPQQYDAQTMLWVLNTLGIKAPHDAATQNPKQLLNWAISHWQTESLSNITELAIASI